ncbi:glycosyltransferase family 92 protein F13G3.3-like [Pelobates fuscus]|uniref:glycosyltransferase family 92 protein F13G3.3-like n=1 Tax=Pelobates fuscus TaxID=191477 RepID=UPI002FE4F625
MKKCFICTQLISFVLILYYYYKSEKDKPGRKILHANNDTSNTITAPGDNQQPEEEKPGSRILYVPNIANSTITALSDNQTFILAPYYDLRGPTPIIRVLAIIHHSVRELYCWFHCIHSSSVTVRAEVDLHAERYGYPYGTADLLCTEPPNCSYHYISVHWSNATNITQLLLFEVRNRPPHTLSVNFTVCISTMYGDYNNVLQTIQSIEMYKLLGAGRVTIYVNKCHENVDKVLQYYIEEGILEVVPWPIDKFLRTSKLWRFYLNKNSQVHYYGQTATLNDCLNRNMYKSKFVFFNGIDEIILPRKHYNWGSLMQSLQQQYPQTSVLIFENHVFKTSANRSELNIWEDIPGVNILLHNYRDPNNKYINSYKFVVDPRQVYQIRVHRILKSKGKHEHVSKDTVIIFHTKGLQEKYGDKSLIEDRTLWRFNLSLTQNVKVIQRVFLHR